MPFGGRSPISANLRIDFFGQAIYYLGMKKYIDEDWHFLTTFFPKDWEAKAKELKALTRKRKFNSPGELLRLLLIHLGDGCSAREAVVRAKQGGLVEISDVALIKRLRASSNWLKWMSTELIQRRGVKIKPPEWLSSYTVKSVDASTISEPGSTGTDWRLHYSMMLFSLQADQFIITKQDVGESFLNFKIQPNDLYIGDRAYGRLKGLKYIRKHQGHFIARIKNKSFKIYDNDLNEIKLINLLQGLTVGQVKDVSICADVKNKPKFQMRLCAIKKSDEEADISIKKALRQCSKRQRKVNPETIELHRYIILVTSLPNKISAKQILDLYRVRWQIEIAFKRFKSILGLGHLPKKDIESARAWLHGKMFVALLTQTIIDEGRFFSPWGYPLQQFR